MTKIKNIYRYIRYVLLQRHFFGITAKLRVLPNFIVIGVGRSGTTSLYRYLNQHSCISKSAYDEIGFFDENYHLGVNWYRSMFPTKFHRDKILKKYGNFMTYEVTPWYIRRPWIAKRISKLLPNVKLIVVLRNPIDRAYSHFHLSVRTHGITKSFEETITEDIQKINQNNESNKVLTDDYFKDFVQNSFLARGFYAEQLEQWYKIFNKDQLLVISSEDLSQKTQDTLNQIFKFLGLEPEKIKNLDKVNVAKYPPMDDKTRSELIEYFHPYNEKLYHLLGRTFNWNI